MKKLMSVSVLIILSFFSVQCKKGDSSAVSPSDKPGVIMYTTADILNVRKTPSVNALIISQIPFGSSLRLQKTDTSNTISGKNYYWYYSDDIKGFILSQYLVDSAPRNRKEFKMHFYHETEGGRTEKNLTLSCMKAVMSVESGYASEVDHIEYSGTYRFDGSSIILEWAFINRPTIGGQPNQQKKEQTSGSETIAWVSEFNAWIDGYDFNKMKKEKYEYNSQYGFISFPDKSDPFGGYNASLWKVVE